jgi:indole-3-glycerol phosphate synthase
MNILDKIIDHKKLEVSQQKLQSPIEKLADTEYYNRKTLSLYHSIQQDGSTGIIAEFKRRSPSKGIINSTSSPLNVVKAYQSAGASAISILTDLEFFGGSNEDILSVRDNIKIPILRKEFIIDPYQIHQAKSIGADLILLIAACLTPTQVSEFASLARELSLEVLLELHDESELAHICDEVHFVGINNRSLKTFHVDINRSIEMSKKIPAGKLKIAESGIDDPATVKIFRDNGYSGFLIGENFMKTEDPGFAIMDFIKQINN